MHLRITADKRYQRQDVIIVNKDSTIVVYVLLQSTCSSILFDSDLIGKLWRDQGLGITMVEKMKIEDKTVDIAYYPDWFPVILPKMRYNQDFCLSLCDFLTINKDRTAVQKTMSDIVSVNFEEPWNSSLNHTRQYEGYTMEKDCVKDCPKSEISYTLNIRTIDYPSISLVTGTDLSNQSYVSFTFSSSYMTLKKIRWQKSFVEIVSEIGGNLGLFVGVSLLTLVEIGQLIISGLYAKFSSKKINVQK